MVNQRRRATAHEGDLDAVFGALSDPTRRGILQRLMAGPAAVQELAAPYQMTAPAITKHLNVLERAGLISRERVGRTRECRLRGAPIAAATEFLAPYNAAFWEGTLDRLEAHLASGDASGRGTR